MSMKVLIADPDWRFAEHATSYLESRAHLVVHETQAERALKQATHWKPDLVIAAAELAGNGLLEALGRLQPRPAVLLTDWMDRFDRVWRAWQHGGDELLMKPVFNVEELHASIVTAMENAAVGTRRRERLAASA